jgi:hypothetical protein
MVIWKHLKIDPFLFHKNNGYVLFEFLSTIFQRHLTEIFKFLKVVSSRQNRTKSKNKIAFEATGKSTRHGKLLSHKLAVERERAFYFLKILILLFHPRAALSLAPLISIPPAHFIFMWCLLKSSCENKNFSLYWNKPVKCSSWNEERERARERFNFWEMLAYLHNLLKTCSSHPPSHSPALSTRLV